MTIKINNLSKNIVDIMTVLSENEGLVQLLLNNDSNPFIKPIEDKFTIINPKSENCRIYPYPFNPEASDNEASFIRVYYNTGEFDASESIQELNLHIDIIIPKSLWLINDGNRSLIRPYEIMDRVIDLIGKRSINSIIQTKFDGWQHFSVNTKFDAIRLYSEYFSIEADNHYG